MLYFCYGCASFVLLSPSLPPFVPLPLFFSLTSARLGQCGWIAGWWEIWTCRLVVWSIRALEGKVWRIRLSSTWKSRPYALNTDCAEWKHSILICITFCIHGVLFVEIVVLFMCKWVRNGILSKVEEWYIELSIGLSVQEVSSSNVMPGWVWWWRWSWSLALPRVACSVRSTIP